MPLNVLKASAGSGKTHKLTEVYLKLLFKNPDNYSKILAITFTNMATNEMKERILQELFVLSNNASSAHKETLILQEKNSSEKQISEKAEKILNTILYNYDHFRISTIDSFFQSIIQAFVSELGIKYSYNIELDQEAVLGKAIDRLIAETGNEKETTQWLIDFAMRKIAEGKNWNFKNDIQSFGKEIFKESFSIREEMQDEVLKKQIRTCAQSLNSIIKDFEKHLSDLAKKALDIIHYHNLNIHDFAFGKYGIGNYFSKLAKGLSFDRPGKRISEMPGQKEKWYAKTQAPEIVQKITEACEGGLNDILEDIIALQNKKYPLYQSALNISKNLFALGIITNIQIHLRAIRDEDNMLLISDLPVLLHALINNNDSPFIYEKCGSYIKHYLIDEFQDTSEIQWNNIYPLLANSLSLGYLNFLVGDVKQSIYRWRGANWKILAQKLREQVHPDMISFQNLDTNWRSNSNIVSFNNRFFQIAPKILQNVFNQELKDSENAFEHLKTYISQAFSQHEQKVSPAKKDKKACVQIRFINNEDTGWKIQAQKYMFESIDALLEKGYSKKDIAILVRKSSDGNEIAEALVNNNYSIISRDSLFLHNSDAVGIIIAALNYSRNKKDTVNIATLSYLYSDYHNLKIPDFHNGDFRDILPKLDRINFKNKTLIEICENIVEVLELNTRSSEGLYIQSFMDEALMYSIHFGNDPSDFLEWWEKEGIQKNIHIPEEVDAIRILTIHKSKGLDFPIVIVPYCNWEFEQNQFRNIIWCSSALPEFSQISPLPLSYGKKMEESTFSSYYFEEKIQNYLDNLNLLYVAFTRAEEGFFAFCPKRTNISINNAASLLFSVFEQAGNYPYPEDVNPDAFPLSRFDSFWNSESLIYEEGEITTKKDKKEEKAPDILHEHYIRKLLPRLQIKKKKELSLSQENMDSLDFGKEMHQLLSEIKYKEDISDVLQRNYHEKNVQKADFEKINAMLDIIINHPEASLWFDKKWKIKTECPLILPGGKIQIPDRIIEDAEKILIIDFKFGRKHPEHNKQIQAYTETLKKMSSKHIQGKLFYVNTQEVLAF
jgi:ATP-dependent helicase/nuclease subunit A